MRLLTFYELRRHWRCFQQRTGWILGFRETIILFVLSTVVLWAGIPAYFGAMPVVEKLIAAFGHFLTDVVAGAM